MEALFHCIKILYVFIGLLFFLFFIEMVYLNLEVVHYYVNDKDS
jgi:hypothetical protein